MQVHCPRCTMTAGVAALDNRTGVEPCMECGKRIWYLKMLDPATSARIPIPAHVEPQDAGEWCPGPFIPFDLR